MERVINELFEGHTHNFIECVHVDYKSSRRESFMDLQLDVKGCANVYESFDKCAGASGVGGGGQPASCPQWGRAVLGSGAHPLFHHPPSSLLPGTPPHPPPPSTLLPGTPWWR